jgi:hypothetical protein
MIPKISGIEHLPFSGVLWAHAMSGRLLKTISILVMPLLHRCFSRRLCCNTFCCHSGASVAAREEPLSD